VSKRDDLIAKLSDEMAPDNAAVFVYEVLREELLRYDARHVSGCPQLEQNYWRMRPEYRRGPDKPCTCGLDALLGKHDDRKQS